MSGPAKENDNRDFWLPGATGGLVSGRQRAQRADAGARLGGDQAGAAGELARGAARAAAHDARLALRDVARVGTRSRVFLQRRLCADAGAEASDGARAADAAGLAGDLRRYRGPDPGGDAGRRRHLGQGAAAAAGAQRLSRGDLSHLLLQSAARRPRRRRGADVRGERGDRAGDQPAPAGHAGRARRRAAQHPDAGRGAGAGAGDAGREPVGHSVQPDLSARDRRALDRPCGKRGRGRAGRRGLAA
jgi:hypothetical protein